MTSRQAVERLLNSGDGKAKGDLVKACWTLLMTRKMVLHYLDDKDGDQFPSRGAGKTLHAGPCSNRELQMNRLMLTIFTNPLKEDNVPEDDPGVKV